MSARSAAETMAIAWRRLAEVPAYDPRPWLILDPELELARRSTPGTLDNRDAGVIIHNGRAAKYFQEIFLHDWENLAVQKGLPD